MFCSNILYELIPIELTPQFAKQNGSLIYFIPPKGENHRTWETEDGKITQKVRKMRKLDHN